MKFLNQQSSKDVSKYVEYLKLIGSLSNLFSSSEKPFIQYRVAENAFCKAFNAENLARADVAYDAIKDGVGIGCKTFILSGASKIEKVAEFNSYSAELRQLEGLNLAKRLAFYRNERILFADREYEIKNRVYHIVGRDTQKIKLFDTSYDLINSENIEIIADTRSSLKFKDDLNEYNFNYSKSVLMKRFTVPGDCIEIDVDIIHDPLELLINLDPSKKGGLVSTVQDLVIDNVINSVIETEELIPGEDYVILPLYSPRAKERNREPIVPLKSQLNQWNAGGRARDFGEVYIAIPSLIHQLCPGFFPDRDVQFSLRIPNGEILTAKLCQDGSKALMTSPNNALADWMLRRVLQLSEGEKLTYEHLLRVGYDCVKIVKVNEFMYSIDFNPLNSYEQFINI
jgi:hypothetical protein